MVSKQQGHHDQRGIDEVVAPNTFQKQVINYCKEKIIHNQNVLQQCTYPSCYD